MFTCAFVYIGIYNIYIYKYVAVGVLKSFDVTEKVEGWLCGGVNGSTVLSGRQHKRYTAR